MTRSLLEIVQDATNEIGILQPSALVGENEPDARRFLALANRVGRELSRQNWAILQKVHTFTTTSGTTEYALPSDWLRSIQETAYQVDEYWQARGSVTPQDWRYIQNTLGATPGLRDTFIIRRNTTGNAKAFHLYPSPASGQSLVFEYISDQWVTNSGGTIFRSSFGADNDQPLFDDHLFTLGVITYIRRAEGLDYQTEWAEFQAEANRTYAQDVPRRKINLGGEKLYLWGNIPETGFGG